jgi:hypothetical protein
MAPNKRNSQASALVVILLILASVVQLARGGEPQRITAAPGLIELRLTNASGDVSWECRDPLTLDYRVYESGAVLVTYLARGQAVFVSDVIDWEKKLRDKTVWVVTVGSDPQPQPQPPNPTPDSTPDTVPPGLPTDVYLAAKAIQQPASALKFATAFRTVAAEIAAGALLSPAAIQPRITELCRGIAPNDDRWRQIGAKIGAVVRNSKSAAEIRALFEDVAIALEMAGKP